MPARAKLTTNEISQSTISVDNFAIGDEMSHAEMDSNFLNLRDQTFGIVGDDSTGIDVKAGDTIKFLGQGATSVAVIGNQVVISSTDTGEGGGGVTSMRFVGDDSTGVTISDGETLKITGSQNISVIASQDTVTITGPDLSSFATASSSTAFTNKSGNISQWTNDSGYVTASSSTAFTNKTGNISQWTNNSGYLTNSTITIVGDDSTGTTLNTGETIKVVGAGTVTTAVVNDVLTITGTGGGTADLGDLQVNGTTLSPINTNSDLILTANGTGAIELNNNGRVYDSVVVHQAINRDSVFYSNDDPTTSQWTVLEARGSGTATGNSLQLSSYSGDIFVTATSGTDTVNLYTPSGTGPSSAGLNLNVGVQLGAKIKFGKGTGAGGDGSVTMLPPDTGSGSLVIGFDQITSLNSNQNITITPNGAGSIVLDGLNWPQADGTNGQILSTNGAGQLSFITNTASTGDIVFTGNNISTSSTNANLELSAAGTGVVHATEQLFKVGTGSNTAFISSEGNNNLVLAANTTPSSYSGTTNTEAFIEINNNGNIVLRTAGDDYIYMNCDQLSLGKTTAPNYNADCTVTAAGHGDLTLTNNSGGGSAPFIKIKKMTSNATADGDIDISPRGGSGSTARINFKTTTQTGVGANGAATALTANPVGYMKVKINDTEYQIPYYNV